jgi:hypothetical protein
MKEVLQMFPIVELPEIVQHYTPWFEPVFSDEALIQFQRYLSGLIVSENKYESKLLIARR